MRTVLLATRTSLRVLRITCENTSRNARAEEVKAQEGLGLPHKSFPVCSSEADGIMSDQVCKLLFGCGKH